MTPVEGAKVLFTGPAGAGKTTAIRALSEIAAPAGDDNSDDRQPVAFDYGEFRLEGGAPMRLYGAPEQLRFDFMWKALADDAMGLVVLLDHRRPDPAADALHYVQSFGALARRGACVVAVGRFDAARAPNLCAISFRLETAGYKVAVIEIDVRRAAYVRRMMQALVALARRDAVTPQDAQPTAPALLRNS